MALRRLLTAWVATLSALIMIAPSVLAGGASAGIDPNPDDSVNISNRTMPLTSITSACSGVPVLGVAFVCSTPGVSQIPVPAGATQAKVVVIGGGGGGGSRGAGGGHGAEVTATVSLTDIESLLITVASGGGGSIEGGAFDPVTENPIKGGSSGGGTVGQFGTYGAAADVIPVEVSGLWTGGAAGGGMSAIADGTGKTSSSPMALTDLLIIAGGGGGAAIRDPGAGGDGGAGATAAGGDGVPDDASGAVAAKGGSGGFGGTGAVGGGSFTNGRDGGDFRGTDPSPWGTGGAGAFDRTSSGGAGYGGGGGASSGSIGSAAAGGSFALAARTIGTAAFAASNNGGVAATGGARGGTGGNGSVEITFFGPDTISTTSTIANSAQDPQVQLTTTSVFAGGVTVDDFTVTTGGTGLSDPVLVRDSDTQVTFSFTGTAQPGTIAITALASAFNPASIASSNTVTITVPDPPAPWTLIHQSIPLSESGTCEGLDDEFAAYGTGIRGGWVRSWEPWVNQTLGANGERIGGWACSRVLVNRGGTAWFVMD